MTNAGKLLFIGQVQALPFGEGAPGGGRERCNKMLQIDSDFGEFALPAHLFRHALRHATFPKGEGLSARQNEI